MGELAVSAGPSTVFLELIPIDGVHQREDDECVICLEKAKLRPQVQNMQKMHLAVKDVFINI